MEKHSAILPGYIPIGIRANHSEMTKFADVHDPGFDAVCGELRRWVRSIGGTQQLGSFNEAEQTRGEQDRQGKLGGSATQLRESVAVLENVVAIREKTLAEDHPDRLASQYELAMAYRANGQANEAVQLL